MATILDQIIQHKRREVAERQSIVPVKLLESSLYFSTKPLSLRHYLLREIERHYCRIQAQVAFEGLDKSVRARGAHYLGLHAGRCVGPVGAHG